MKNITQPNAKPKKTRSCPPISTHMARLNTSFKLLTALPDGAASWYSTWGPIAIYYYRGSWLIGPVALGATITMTDEVLAAFLEKYPNNRFFKALHNKTVFANHGIGGFMADFGFAWGAITTMGVLLGGVDYAQNDFARILAPLLAVLPAILTRSVTYKMEHHHSPSKLMRHAGFFIRGAVAPSGITDALLQQSLLATDSIIPPALTVITSLLGLCASLIKESYPRSSQTLETLLTLLFENPSLVAMFFNLPNDLYAAKHNNMISNAFFFSNAGVSSLFLLLLSLITIITQFSPERDPTQTAHDTIRIEASNEEPEEEERNHLLNPAKPQKKYDTALTKTDGDEDKDYVLIDMLETQLSINNNDRSNNNNHKNNKAPEPTLTIDTDSDDSDDEENDEHTDNNQFSTF